MEYVSRGVFLLFIPISALIEFIEQMTKGIHSSDLMRPIDLQVRNHMGRPEGQILHLRGILYNGSFFHKCKPLGTFFYFSLLKKKRFN